MSLGWQYGARAAELTQHGATWSSYLCSFLLETSFKNLGCADVTARTQARLTVWIMVSGGFGGSSHSVPHGTDAGESLLSSLLFTLRAPTFVL